MFASFSFPSSPSGGLGEGRLAFFFPPQIFLESKRMAVVTCGRARPPPRLGIELCSQGPPGTQAWPRFSAPHTALSLQCSALRALASSGGLSTTVLSFAPKVPPEPKTKAQGGMAVTYKRDGGRDLIGWRSRDGGRDLLVFFAP